jgi:hypothetical protein
MKTTIICDTSWLYYIQLYRTSIIAIYYSKLLMVIAMNLNTLKKKFFEELIRYRARYVILK